MRRLFTIIVLLMIFAMLGVLVWVSNQLGTITRPRVSKTPVKSELHQSPPFAAPPIR